jgi:hypothetical protein
MTHHLLPLSASDRRALLRDVVTAGGKTEAARIEQATVSNTCNESLRNRSESESSHRFMDRTLNPRSS